MLEEQDFDFEQKPVTGTLKKVQIAETGFEGSQCIPFWCQFVNLLFIWHSDIMYWFCCRLEKYLWQYLLCCFSVLMSYVRVERVSGSSRCSFLEKKEWIVIIWGRESFRLQWSKDKIKGNEGLRAQTPIGTSSPSRNREELHSYASGDVKNQEVLFHGICRTEVIETKPGSKPCTI